MKKILQNKKTNFKVRIAIALSWLCLIYLFLPFAPRAFNFLSEKFGASIVKRTLAIATVVGAIFAYLPFIKKFKIKTLWPYVIITVVLTTACVINITSKIQSQTLHIPEYLLLSVFFYRAFMVKYKFNKSYMLTAVISISAGIIDERFIQYYLPVRVYDLSDILLNVGGAITGLILILAYNMPAYKR